MERYHYEGIRPHVRSASAAIGAEADRVERFEAVRRFNDLLCQAVTHHNLGDGRHVPATLQAARPYLFDLEAALEACRRAFAEVSHATADGVREGEFAPPDVEEPIVTYPVAVELATILNQYDPDGTGPVATLRRLIDEASRPSPTTEDADGSDEGPPPGDGDLGGESPAPLAEGPESVADEQAAPESPPAEDAAGQEAVTEDEPPQPEPRRSGRRR